MNTSAATQLQQHLNPEVWLVTAQAAGRSNGLIATTVCPASIVADMPRMLVSLARQHLTWELVEAGGAFALHLLSEECLDWVWHFGLQSGRNVDKLSSFEWHTGRGGSPILAGNVAGWLDCRVEAKLDGGDRTIYLAQVLDASRHPDRSVLRMHRLMELASAEKLAKLKECRQRGSEVDAAAILAWRAQNIS